MREFYHSQDIKDAEWIIQTNENLNHGLPAMMWAWRVIKWYLDLYEHVRSQVSRLHIPIRTALDNTLRLVKCGVLRFGIG
jgi:hypothetical protein